VDHNPKSNAIFAFVLSLMFAIGAAFGLEYLNRRITDVEGIEEVYELPALTEVPKVDSPAPLGDTGVTMAKELHEPFRRLQTNLEMLSRQKPIRTIVIASAAPGEGKSIVARNLALAYQEAGRDVAVLDADLRKATLGRLLAASDGPGLADILAGHASFGEAIQPVAVPMNGNGHGPAEAGDSFSVASSTVHAKSGRGDLGIVPAGVHTGNLPTALASDQMRQTLKTVTDRYGVAIIDSPPLLAVADVLPLLSEADAVLVVARVGVTTRDSAQRLLAELKRIPSANVVGVVANGIPPRLYRTRAYGYYYG
jgi:Mrp family chromosome partitioning ATPase